MVGSREVLKIHVNSEYRHMHIIKPGTNANVLVAVKSKVCLLFEMKRKTIKYEQAFNPPLNIKRPL